MQPSLTGAQTIVTPDQHVLSLNVQPHFFTLADNLIHRYSFDGEGRLIGAFREGVNYRRGLRGDVLRKQALAPGQKLRHMLNQDERQTFLHEMVTHMRHLAGQLETVQQPELNTWLERILAWDVPRLEAERERFDAIYKPISILPPDHYQAVVVQATEGCSWNRCTFCTLYHDRPFRIKGPEELCQHIHEVQGLLGRGMGLRNAIFLGDANALIIPQRRLRELLEVVQREFALGAGNALRGIYAFLDIFGAERKSVAAYRELREAQVRRIYLGLETGDPEVFGLLNKPGSPAACVEVVQAIKAAGISVGVILLAGAGGARLAAQHVANSLRIVGAMGLGEGDLVYLSPLMVPDESPYLAQLRAANSQPLDEQAIEAQLAHLKAGIKTRVEPATKVVLYHLSEFIY
ncbi:MAG: radical SAM protein [Chloroflexia bacterium]|nr:radical SAM protein [Chloroflexia bacterium]